MNQYLKYFGEINKNTIKNISNIFDNASQKMKTTTASLAWEQSIDEVETNLNKEDRQALKTLSKLLGQTDVEGQVCQIEMTENFIEKQLKDASEERNKNEKLYSRLGTIIGLAIVIVLL